MSNLNQRADPDDLVSFEVLGIANVQPVGQTLLSRWQNPTGRRIKIVGARCGSWCLYGLRADVYLSLWREADNTMILDGGWDHYQEPTLPYQGRPEWFHPYGFYLYPGDWLRVVYGYAPFSGPQSVTQAVTIWCPSGQ